MDRTRRSTAHERKSSMFNVCARRKEPADQKLPYFAEVDDPLALQQSVTRKLRPTDDINRRVQDAEKLPLLCSPARASLASWKATPQTRSGPERSPTAAGTPLLSFTSSSQSYGGSGRCEPSRSRKKPLVFRRGWQRLSGPGAIPCRPGRSRGLSFVVRDVGCGPEQAG